jgi:hypothetical protein
MRHFQSSQRSTMNPHTELIQRTWSNPEILTPQFLTFTDEAIYWIDTCKPERAAELRRRLEAGEKPGTLFGHEAKVVPLAKLASLSFDRNDSALELTFWKEDEQESETFTLQDTAIRDRLFAQLKQHLGEAWATSEEKYTPLKSVMLPLLCMLGVAAVTAGLWWWATAIAETAALNGGTLPAVGSWKLWLVDEALYYLTPLGVLILGGLIVLGLGGWIQERIKTPPHVVTLSRLKTTS